MKLLIEYVKIIAALFLVVFVIACDSKNEFSTLEDRGVALNFVVKETAVQENNGNGVQINIAFLATTVEVGTITIEIGSQAGLVYDTDFTTVPDGSSGEILIDIPVGSTKASFQVFPKNMPGEDSVKSVSFRLSSTSGGVFIGTQQDFTLYITDEPIILINSSLSDFGNVEQGFTSASQSYTISVVSLVGAVTVTAPANFEVSSNNTSFSSSLSLAATAFTNGQATIYVRLVPDANAPLGASNGSIIHSSTGATNKAQAVVGNIIAPIPTIFVNESLTDFGNVPQGQLSSSQSYMVEGHALTNDVTITAPPHFEVSKDDMTFSSEIVIDYTSIEGTPTTVYVRFAPTIVASISEDIVHTSNGATTVNTTVTGTGEDPSILIAYTSFESPPLGAEYVDTFFNNVDHDLINNLGQNFVDFTAAAEIGYNATYTFTRQFATPAHVNDIGVVDDPTNTLSSVDFFPGPFPDGAQGYKLFDTEGQVNLTFDAVDISAYTTVSINIDIAIFNQFPYEIAASSHAINGVLANDKIRIYVIVDEGLGTQAEIDLFNEINEGITAAAPQGNVTNEGWETKTADLSGFNMARLVIEVDTDQTNEGLFFDDIVFKGSN